MFGKIIDVGIAKLCAMCATPNHLGVFKNNSSAGGSTQICYTAYGSGQITTSNGSAVYEEGVLTDVSHVRGLQMNGLSGPNGTIWIGINPADERTIDYNFIQGEQQVQFVGEKLISVLLCLKGSITANGKTLLDLNYSVIPEGMSVDISVPNGSDAIIFWLRDI
jgi:hypothetical protein